MKYLAALKGEIQLDDIKEIIKQIQEIKFENLINYK